MKRVLPRFRPAFVAQRAELVLSRSKAFSSRGFSTAAAGVGASIDGSFGYDKVGSAAISKIAAQPSEADMKLAIKQILTVLPSEWRGTTFNNSKVLGREGFTRSLEDLIMRKFADGEEIKKDELSELGNAEDYMRVATNISTLLEAALAIERGLDVSQVFTFASETLPIFAVCMVSKFPVRLYLGDGESPFSHAQQGLLTQLGAPLTCYPSYRTQPPRIDEVVLCLEGAVAQNAGADGIIGPNVLYIMDPEKIAPADVLVVRKRMSTPMTTPVAEGMLQSMAGMRRGYATVYGPAPPGVAKFYAHLQTLSGTQVDKKANPVVSTVGLSAISSLWITLIGRGGADILMCSTAYGGSCQMTEIFAKSEANLRKHDFHVHGAGILPSIRAVLAKLVEDKSSMLPTTVVFLEIPTNPDMRVPDLSALAGICAAHREASGKKVLLLIDATFAPGSRVLEKLEDLSADLCAMVFISMSKSVSRGLTTAGAVIGNHTKEAKDILKGVGETCEMLDTLAKPDQMARLVDNHAKVEQRCREAYNVAVTVGERLCKEVKAVTGHDMHLAFVTPQQAAMGFTTSTFSFNLPSPSGVTDDVREALAQRFVDSLCVHSEFKPCVSFGQDNGLVYATVPATSTQGAIKAEDKAKQAVGGVQLTRLSFPPTCDIEAVCQILSESVIALYK